jgi:hypothetical protein
MNLLANMDKLHPDILIEHSIQPRDYKYGLVFRSAIESIRGTFIASSTTGREGLVKNILDQLLKREKIIEYSQSSKIRRYDFIIKLKNNPDQFAAIEVKGGEGNSINISERPLWAKEFGVWCHLDGAIVNQPDHGVHAIINRITNELVRRHKLVDVLFIKDILCGTNTRPCPKYPKYEEKIGMKASPDIFLLPKLIPTLDKPEPPTHTLNSLILPRIILDIFDVPRMEQDRHIWEVHVKLIEMGKGILRRVVKIYHQGDVIDESVSRSWR